MGLPQGEEHEKTAREWLRILKYYRDPSTARSMLELLVTAGPLLALWAAGIAVAQISVVLSLLLGCLSGLFLVRLFIIQHDCGHGSFLSNRKHQDWVGRICGVLTYTPYADWKYVHSVHHAHAGHLEKEVWGDVYTMTVSKTSMTWSLDPPKRASI